MTCLLSSETSSFFNRQPVRWGRSAFGRCFVVELVDGAVVDVSEFVSHWDPLNAVVLGRVNGVLEHIQGLFDRFDRWEIVFLR